MAAISTDTFPCRNSVHPIRSWPTAATLTLVKAKSFLATREVKDLVPRMRIFLNPIRQFWVSASILAHPRTKFCQTHLEEHGASMVGAAVQMCQSLRSLTAVGAPVIKNILDASKIAPGCADSYTLL